MKYINISGRLETVQRNIRICSDSGKFQMLIQNSCFGYFISMNEYYNTCDNQCVHIFGSPPLPNHFFSIYQIFIFVPFEPQIYFTIISGLKYTDTGNK